MIPGIFAGEEAQAGSWGSREEAPGLGGGKETPDLDGFSVVLSAVMKDKLRCELLSLQHCPRAVGTVCRGNSVLDQGPGNV